MAETHPYISGAGNIAKMIKQLRKAFPSNISADTIKKLGYASNSESYLINILVFIGLIDTNGNKTPKAADIFTLHKDEEFSNAFGELIEKAYQQLFTIHGKDTWDLSPDNLITFFRQNDQTSEAIGKRQAQTFKMLASLSGHGESPLAQTDKMASASRKVTPQNKFASKPKGNKAKNSKTGQDTSSKNEIGLSVRIEINLPADGTKEVYDNIFKSIKENLLDA